ncbi:beat protein [Holotrichia oblita]|uniref:Beat protein n=1 Tax=Holotrichia oblita TaxID=644536 RepID=A0ACB9SY71_HOLOL|nr:beat protein [Holotrichia oblita]
MDIDVLMRINSFFICLQIGKSTPNTVVLRNVQQNMTGKYGCEVSTDAPNFYTLVTSAYMYIVRKYL